MLEARAIHKVYHVSGNDLHVLKGIDVAIKQGEFVVISGPSGAGKSTLLHILGGLDAPTGGEVFLKGKDIYRASEAQVGRIRNEKLGFVFQFYHLLPAFTVLENVMLPALIGNRNGSLREKIRDAATQLLKEMGLEGRLGHFPSELSGGEKQRVAIARALINKPEFILCDEPTGNLDSATGSHIIGLIVRMRQHHRTGIVMVTHNQQLSAGADRVYQLIDGVLAQ